MQKSALYALVASAIITFGGLLLFYWFALG